MNNLVQILGREKADLKILLWVIFVIPAIWLLTLGWKPSLSISSADAAMVLLPYFKGLAAGNGDWQKTLYRADILGGVVSHDVLGGFPLLAWLLRLGASPIQALNGFCFFIQAVIAFLSVRAISDLLRIWKPAQEVSLFTAVQMVSLILLTGFAPIVGGRLAVGHQILLVGTFVFLASFSLGLAAVTGRLSLTLLFVAVLAYTTAFPSAGQQMVLYSGVFGLPILLGIVATSGRGVPWTSFGIVFLIALGSFGISLPEFSGLFAHATSGDTERVLSGASVVHSFETAKIVYWWNSLTWARDFFKLGEETGYIHERDLAFGPLLVLLALVPWKKIRGLGIGFVLSFLLALVWTVDLWPISTLMQDAVSPLRIFRVAQRSFLCFSFCLPIFAGASLIYLDLPALRFAPRKDLKKYLLALLPVFGSSLVFFIPPGFREGLIWLFGLGLIGAFYYTNTSLKIGPHFVLPLLAVASLAGFQERFHVFFSSDQQINYPAQLRNQVVSKIPELVSPLERSKFNPTLPGYFVNSGVGVGLSTLEGYWSPPKRFNLLATELEGRPYDPMRMVFIFEPSSLPFQVLRQLYNINYLLDYQGANTIAISRFLEGTAGAAWFSSEWVPVSTFSNLAEAFKTAGQNLGKVAHRKVWVIDSDPAVRERVRSGTDYSLCSSAEVQKVDVLSPQEFHIVVKTEADCPLTVSTNFSELLQATSLQKGEMGQSIPLFPTYGALTGLIVPKGTTEITIRAVRDIPRAAQIGSIVGAFLILFAVTHALRKRYA